MERPQSVQACEALLCSVRQGHSLAAAVCPRPACLGRCRQPFFALLEAGGAIYAIVKPPIDGFYIVQKEAAGKATGEKMN